MSRMLNSRSHPQQVKVSGPCHVTPKLKSIVAPQVGHRIWWLFGDERNFLVTDSK